MSEKDKIERIRERILRSGFPLEIEIGNLLRKHGWLVFNQMPYVDKESGKIRLADVVAIKMEIHQKISGVLLLIECKKSRKHDWIFHTQEKIKEPLPLLGMLVDFIAKMRGSKIPYEGKLSGLHILDTTIRVGVLHMISSKDRDDFHVATGELISALRSIRETMKSYIVFPMIVFDGEIFEFYQENNETKVLPTSHLQFMSFEKTSSGTKPLLIDVVRKTHFSEFLKVIEHDLDILQNLSG